MVTSLMITLGLFIRSQSTYTMLFDFSAVNSARRLRPSFQSEKSSLRHQSVQFELAEPVNMFQCCQGHFVCQVKQDLMIKTNIIYLPQNCKNKGSLTECPSCRGPIVGRHCVLLSKFGCFNFMKYMKIIKKIKSVF